MNITTKKYDLAVAGGGFAGIAAALAAARGGLKVILAERGNCLGGAAVTGLINPFMYYWTMVDGEPKYLCAGIFREILDELSGAGGLGEDGSTFDEEMLKLILNRMAVKAGIDLLYHSYLFGADVSVNKDGKTLSHITVANKSGCMDIPADYFIDATGDADLAAVSDFPFRLGREADSLCQPMTLCFRLMNVDAEKYRSTHEQITPLYQKYQKEGKIKNIREDVLIFDTLTDGVLHFNSTRVVRKNPTDAFDITAAEIEAREQVFELHGFLKENFDAFRDSKIMMTAPQIGVRESRMIDGEYILTGQDLVSCVKFGDSIAAGNYDIDIHNPEGSGTSHCYFPQGVHYTIPYRSLIPKDSMNLLVAGRCISATHEAQASIRVIPIVCCIGEAAGTAAAIACRDNVPVGKADVSKLQNTLSANGAFF